MREEIENKELERLLTQVFALKQLCFSQNKSMMAMLNLQSRGITEEQIISLSNILQRNQSILVEGLLLKLKNLVLPSPTNDDGSKDNHG
jgi:hypothetical protein